MKNYAKIIVLLVTIISGIAMFNSCNKTDSVVTPGNSASWVKMFGGGLSEILTSVKVASSGGFIAAGYTVSFGSGGNEIYVIRINTDGSTQWSKTFGSVQNDETASVLSLADGSFIVAGRTNSVLASNYDAFAIKLDANGNKVWDKIYQWNGNVITTSVQATNDNGFVIAGTSTFTPGQTDGFVLKIDGSGSAVWLKAIGGGFNDICTSLKSTSDNGFIMCGSTFSGGFPDGDGFLCKLNSDGSVAWTNFYGGDDGYDQFNDVVQSNDGGYTAAGFTKSFGLIDGDIYLVRTDQAGNILTGWPRTLGDSTLGLDAATSIVQGEDGTFTITGERTTLSSATTDIIVANYSANSDYNWAKVYGSSGNDAGVSIVKNSDKYVVGCVIASGGAGDNDMYVMNIKSDGTCCAGTNSFTPLGGSPTVTNVSGSFTETVYTPAVLDAGFGTANAATVVTSQCSD